MESSSSFLGGLCIGKGAEMDPHRRLQDDDFDVVIIDNRFDTIPASDLDMIQDLINERGVVHPMCAIFLQDQTPDSDWWLQGWTTPILIGDMAMLFSEKTYS